MSEPDLPITGGCLCGAVRYEIDAPLVSAGYCHCTRCQRRTGTAAGASAVVAPGALRFTRGEELLKAYSPPDGADKVFCTACGGAVMSRSRDGEQRIGVRLGTFDSDPGIRPGFRQHVATAAVWEPLPDDGLPRFDGPRG